MRRILVPALLLLCVVPLIALREAYVTGSDILRKLNIPDDVAHDCIWSSFSGMYLSIPDARALKAVAKGDRAAIVKDIAAYARAYTQTDEFARKYLEYRDTKKPEPPQPPKSMDSLKSEQKASLQKSIAQTEASMKSLDAKTQETMKGVIEVMKTQLKSIDDPANPMYSKDMEAMSQQGYEMQKQEYQKQLAAWEKDYPTSPTPLIRSWLRKFLEVSDGIDFNAQLKDGLGNTKMFVNPEYESKSDQWKMCYRAGKETVAAGRAAAEAWLKDLEKGQ